MRIGYKLMTEAYGPKEIVRQAVAAEKAGFDFIDISDHFHPWLDEQGHSAFAWSMLGAIARGTDQIGLVSGVTCPTMRYHPAIIAQAAATVALLSDGRFTLGLGSGERLNEHVIGREYPAVTQRHAMLREAVDIIRLLWKGGYQSYDGRYLRLEDARVFDLPAAPPLIAIAAGGGRAARLAADRGDALFATEPKPHIVAVYTEAGGEGARYAEVPVAFAADERTALDAALRTTRWALSGWKVMSELPNPANFAAATTTVTSDDLAARLACGADPARYVEVCAEFVAAGFDRLVLMNCGPDPDGFLEFFHGTLAAELRALRVRPRHLLPTS